MSQGPWGPQNPQQPPHPYGAPQYGAQPGTPPQGFGGSSDLSVGS